MAKQYCRYCGFCCEVDGGYYCTDKELLMSEQKIKRPNNCKEYGYTDVGDILRDGVQYKPRGEYKHEPVCELEQLSFTNE